MLAECKTKCKAQVIVNQYIDDVRSGRIAACELVKFAIQRHLSDLEHGHERGLYFDADAAQRIIDFTQLLKQSKGP